MSGSLCAATENKVGVVLIHGKWGNPSQFNSLAKSMSSKGYMVLTPLMPWSKVRGYDIDYSSALEIVTGTIQELRKSGSAVIVWLDTVREQMRLLPMQPMAGKKLMPL